MINIGDFVKWGSQAQGTRKIKEGRVIAIIPKNEPIENYLPDNFRRDKIQADSINKLSDRLLIEVEFKPNKFKYYCPRVSQIDNI